ncbi:hypothetical protein AB0C84_45605 [Actinomadura sp. NPDC048955]|uniref:hypothetical protein n=1 Tax=Actinomadura sp. NPDC048955 TaxID=3158228 RepID=UPI0033D367BB
MASGSETISSNKIDFVVRNEPGAVRFDYEHPCGQEPAYSIWLWGAEDLTHFHPDGTEAGTLTVAPQDLLTAAIIASGFGRIVGYRPIPLDRVELRNHAEVEHMLTQLVGDVHEPLRFRGGRRYVIAFDWDSERSCRSSAEPSDGTRSPACSPSPDSSVPSRGESR